MSNKKPVHLSRVRTQEIYTHTAAEEEQSKNGNTRSPWGRMYRTKEQELDTLELARFMTKTGAAHLDACARRNRENPEHVNHKVFHLLSHPFTYVNAYAKISKNKGALTKGIAEDDEILKWFGQSHAISIAEKVKTQSYTFKPTRRVMIPKPGKKKMRPIDTPTQRDRIVQEALRGILEAVYEPAFERFEHMSRFRATNYGFRPGKRCFQAVQTLKEKGQGCSIAVEGDIVGAYNTIDRKILLTLISKRIPDKKFLRLLRNLLDADVMMDGKVEHTLTGTPQGGIVSPILFNIYMFEFDKFMYERFVHDTLDVPDTRRRSTVYQNLGYKMKTLRQTRDTLEKGSKEYKEIGREIRVIEMKRFSQPSYDLSTLPPRAVYTRYADDWVYLFSGTAHEGSQHKAEIAHFLRETLKLELDPEKTLVSNIRESGITFLGFRLQMCDARRVRHKTVTTRSHGKFQRALRRTTSRKLSIRPDTERIRRNLILKGFCKQGTYTPIGVRKWTIFEPYRIVRRYADIMRGLAGYYRECDSHYVLNQVSYILQYSCAKTIATREKITMSQVFDKYGSRLRQNHRVQVWNKKEQKFLARTYSAHFETYTDMKRSKWMNHVPSDERKEPDPFAIDIYHRTKLKVYACCCICNSSDRVQMHHIQSLRSIPMEKRESFNYLRERYRRLQIPVCHTHHVEITHGKWDNPKSPLDFYDDFIASM